MHRRRGQRGQSLVLAALLITVLIGFVGLVVDGGEAANEQQIVRAAADGAAIAGTYAIAKGSATATATTLAQQVLAAVPLPTGDLTMTYLDAGGSSTAVATSVVTVRAVVSDNHRTFFLGALGVPTLLLTATAEAKNGAVGTTAACALCLMKATTATLNEFANANMTITGGPLQVNSSNGSAINQRNGASLTAPSIIVVGGVNQGTGTITPTPTAGSAIPDPLSAIPVPAVAGVATNFTAPVGVSALPPGVYGTVTVNAGSTLTLSPGTFAIRTRLNVVGGTVIGAGVTIFLGCAAYPTACGIGASGAFISVSAGGKLTLSPPDTGTYTDLTVFADRNNVATDTFAGSTVNVTGTWYALVEPLTDTTSGDSVSFGQLIIASISMPASSTFRASRTIGLTL